MRAQLQTHESHDQDEGLRLVLIDDANAYFSELAATQQRDTFYAAFSSLLLSVCREFGLSVVCTRFADTHAQRQWLRRTLPLEGNEEQPQCASNEFVHFALSQRALFRVLLFREPLHCVDSAVTHPSVCGVIDSLDAAVDIETKKKLLCGDEAATRTWLEGQAQTDIDPAEFIVHVQQKENRRVHGAEEYNIVRGAVVAGRWFKKRNVNEVRPRRSIGFKVNLRMAEQNGFVYEIHD